MLTWIQQQQIISPLNCCCMMLSIPVYIECIYLTLNTISAAAWLNCIVIKMKVIFEGIFHIYVFRMRITLILPVNIELNKEILTTGQQTSDLDHETSKQTQCFKNVFILEWVSLPSSSQTLGELASSNSHWYLQIRWIKQEKFWLIII